MSQKALEEDVKNTRTHSVRICNDCYELRGAMCHNSACIFCRWTMAEVAEYLDKLLIRPVIDGERFRL